MNRSLVLVALTLGAAGAARAQPEVALQNPYLAQATADRMYAAAPNGGVVQVPPGMAWGGHLTAPAPTKVVTWDIQGTWPNVYNTFIGDGDLSISERNGSFSPWKISENAVGFSSPVDAMWWNLDPHFPSPYQHNWTQYAPITSTFLDGAKSSGNTSAIDLRGTSYGMNPSSAYDVMLNANLNRFGQNSTWDAVLRTNDFTGRPPQAFASWDMELDNDSNGHDVSPMDPGYWAPSPGNRVGILYSPIAMPQPGWRANLPVTAKSTYQESSSVNPVAASTVLVKDAAGGLDVFYCVRGGTTGAAAPRFPAPAVVTGSLAGGSLAGGGILTVTALQPDTQPVPVGGIVTGFNLDPSLHVTVKAQLSGTPGGAGRYLTDYPGRGVPPTGLYIAREVADGTAIWDYGTEFASTVRSVLWVSGGPYTAVDTLIGSNATIGDAAIDLSQAKLSASAAALRVAPNQTAIDFSSVGTQASRNARRLFFSATARAEALVYQVGGAGLFAILDNGDARIAGELSTGAAVINRPLATPASSGAACRKGDEEADENYLYVCVAPDRWKRAALSSF